MSIESEELTEAQDDIRAIEGLLSQFGAAVAAGDIEAIRAAYCPEAISVFTGSAGRVRGVSDIVEVWSRHIDAWGDVTIDRTDTLVRIHGDTAWATFTWSGSGSADGNRYEVGGERWSVVLLWEGGSWRFAQTHSSLPFSDWQSLRVESSS